AFGPDRSVSNCAENTVPARALSIDPTNHALNFLYSCSTTAENADEPPYGPLHDYYLAQSTDGGLTWSTHTVFVGDTSGGKRPCTASSGKPDGLRPYTDPKAPAWNVYLAQSTNALSAKPAWQQVVVNATPTHYGQICTNGIVCGSSDRSILDFISVGIDCNG